MNLATDAWIPIVWSDGKPGIVSPRGALERGEGIRDLVVRAHERIALVLRCYVARVENGHTVPSIETLEKISRALEVPIYQLFMMGKNYQRYHFSPTMEKKTGPLNERAMDCS